MKIYEIKKLAYEAGVTEEEYGLAVSWGDLDRFVKLVEKKIREEDRDQAIAFLRQLHDSFSLASDPSGLKRKA
jgi:hypothetical protein